MVALVVVVVLPGASSAQERAGAGMKAHVDPRTGRLVPEPVTPRARPLPAPARPLAEVPGPRGGMVVDLRGRHMSNVIATVNPDGSVRVECVTQP